MELNAAVIIEACRAGAEEAARLAPFLDDLDGWDGADCDTGSNGAATMAALKAAMDSLDPRAHLRDALEAAVETIIRRGLGHSGMALGAIFEAWAGALGDEPHVTPLALRRMLAASFVLQKASGDDKIHSCAVFSSVRSIVGAVPKGALSTTESR